MPFIKYFFFLFPVLMISCHHHHSMPSDQSNPLYDEVMKVHDEIMPEMKTLRQNRKFLKSWKQDNNISEFDQAKVDSLLWNIETAEEGMMNWMSQFKIPDDTLLVENYLLSEKIKIQKVSFDMQSAIKASNDYIQNIKLIEK